MNEIDDCDWWDDCGFKIRKRTSVDCKLRPRLFDSHRSRTLRHDSQTQWIQSRHLQTQYHQSQVFKNSDNISAGHQCYCIQVCQKIRQEIPGLIWSWPLINCVHICEYFGNKIKFTIDLSKLKSQLWCNSLVNKAFCVLSWKSQSTRLPSCNIRPVQIRL